MAKERTLLLVDVSAILHKAVYVNGSLEHKGTFTGGLNGFIAQVVAAVETTASDGLLFALDHAPYYRDEQVKQYKGTRKKKAAENPEMKKKIDITKQLINEFLEIQPAPVWDSKGLEADDLLAYAFYRYRHRFDNIIIMTGDSDLYQLFDNKGATLKFWQGKKKGYFTIEDFKKKWQGITGSQFIRFEAITGGHNGLQGVPGYGKVRAMQALYGPGHWKLLMREWSEVVWGNVRMMTLPHPRISLYKDKLSLRYKEMDIQELRQFCHKHGFASNPKMELAFKKFSGIKPHVK